MKNKKNSRARRTLRRTLDQEKRETQVIDVLNVLGSTTKDASLSVVVDSGSVSHLVKSEDAFKTIDKQSRVKIKGVNGLSCGFRGILKTSILGRNMEAIWFEDLPTNALISTEGLKAMGWETYFKLTGDCLRHAHSGQTIKVEKNTTIAIF